MEPLVFGDCFGWLHGSHDSHSRRGVVVCAPFGYDLLCTHRGWRQLCEQLAQRGLPALRFDYPGAGDSACIEQDPGRFDAWLDSIDAAIDTLRARTGVTEIVLCGFRLGALLAARAAERRGGVDALVLLAPVVSGRLYLRELRAHRQRWLSTPAGLNAQPVPESATYVEAYGFGVHGDDVPRLGAIDLTKGDTLGAKRVLILDSVDRNHVGKLASRYTALGAQVETGDFDEGDRFLVEALYSEIPVHAFGRAVEWIAGGVPVTEASGREPASAPYPPACLFLPKQGARETPVWFDVACESGRYFGVHCVPQRPDPALPVVLFCNTGASHHIGDGRMFVLFARRLAQQGIASLRMDLAGIGDSVPPSAGITLDTIYSDASCADVAAGAQWLAAQGHRRVVVLGVCGGAFNGLHAARLHPAIVGCVSVNLQKFIWDGEARAPGTPVYAQSRLYWRSAFSLSKWLEALRGKASPARAARVITQRAWRALGTRSGAMLARVRGAASDPNPVRRLMRDLAAKGVQVRLLYGEFDVGLEELKIHFGAPGSALRRYPSICVRLLPDLDHALFTEAAREAVMRDTETWLSEMMRDLPAQEASPPSRAAARAARSTDWASDRGALGSLVSSIALEPGARRQGETAPRGAPFPEVES